MDINQDLTPLTDKELAAWLRCLAQELCRRGVVCQTLTPWKSRFYLVMSDTVRITARYLDESAS